MNATISTAVRALYASGYLDLGMTDHAVAELKAIPAEDDFHPDALAAWCRVSDELRDWKSAAVFAYQLTREVPSRPYGWLSWANALFNQGLVARARNALIEAAPHCRTSPNVHFERARYASLLGFIDEAVKHLMCAFALDLKLKPEAEAYPELRSLFGILHQRLAPPLQAGAIERN